MEYQYEYKKMNVAYYTAGAANKEAIVWLHPAFTDHSVFKEQMNYFKENYFLVMIDMIGHGKSQCGQSGVTLENMPEAVHEILESLHIQKAHFVGVSLGSLVAQSVAYQYPTLPQSVTIIGGYSIHKENKDILRRQRKEMLKWIPYLFLPINKFTNYVSEGAVYSPEGKQIFKEGSVFFTKKSFRAMQGMGRLFVEESKEVIYPLLIVCGEHDEDIIKEAGKALAKQEDTGKYVEIKDAGHCVNLDQPLVLNEVLEEFIRSHRISIEV